MSEEKKEGTASTEKWEPKIEFNASLFHGGDRVNHFLVNALRQLTPEEMGILGQALIERSPIDPNQDELWEEFWRNCVESDRGQEYFDYEEAKKRYRITRVTS